MSENGAVPFVRLHGNDNIAIAKRRVEKGTSFSVEPGANPVVAAESVDLGHKIALEPIAKGGPVRKFGQLIGFATEAIATGDWVHSHNLAVGELNLDYAFASDIPADPEPVTDRTFMGYRRRDGRAATRNYIGIISTSDFFLQIIGNNNTNAKSMNARVWGYRAKADSATYAALTSSQLLSA